jgi:hypothetical protein
MRSGNAVIGRVGRRLDSPGGVQIAQVDRRRQSGREVGLLRVTVSVAQRLTAMASKRVWVGLVAQRPAISPVYRSRSARRDCEASVRVWPGPYRSAISAFSRGSWQGSVPGAFAPRATTSSAANGPSPLTCCTHSAV